MLAEKTLSRSDAIDEFLAQAGWAGAARHPLAGDASFRRYERVEHGGRHAMLMDAPPPQEDVRPFVHITRLLHDYGHSAPDIFAQDEGQGFLLLEDLGTALYSAVLREGKAEEAPLYLEAANVLVDLLKRYESTGSVRHLEPYDDVVMLREVSILADWFMPQVVGLEAARELKPEFLKLWQDVLSGTVLQRHTPVLRDYHADNLMWLSGREGMQRVGLLDYQDALLGDSAYDLVSFLEDARRDVSPAVITQVLAHFIEKSGQDEQDFMQRYAVLGAQRNSKIVGIFTRLCVRDGKPHYLDFLPRVWGWLEHDLQHSALAPVAVWMETHIPATMRGRFQADMSAGSLV